MTLVEYIEHRLLERYAVVEAMFWHEAFWGVPTGPTLSMVNPPKFRGLR